MRNNILVGPCSQQEEQEDWFMDTLADVGPQTYRLGLTLVYE